MTDTNCDDNNLFIVIVHDDDGYDYVPFTYILRPRAEAEAVLAKAIAEGCRGARLCSEIDLRDDWAPNCVPA